MLKVTFLHYPLLTNPFLSQMGRLPRPSWADTYNNLRQDGSDVLIVPVQPLLGVFIVRQGVARARSGSFGRSGKESWGQIWEI